MLRVWGDSLRRMAEAEADLWMTDVMQPLFAAGASAAEIGPRTAEFSNALAPLEERAILAVFHGQQNRAWMKNFFEGFGSVSRGPACSSASSARRRSAS